MWLGMRRVVGTRWRCVVGRVTAGGGRTGMRLRHLRRARRRRHVTCRSGGRASAAAMARCVGAICSAVGLLVLCVRRCAAGAGVLGPVSAQTHGQACGVCTISARALMCRRGGSRVLTFPSLPPSGTRHTGTRCGFKCVRKYSTMSWCALSALGCMFTVAAASTVSRCGCGFAFHRARSLPR